MLIKQLFSILKMSSWRVPLTVPDLQLFRFLQHLLCSIATIMHRSHFPENLSGLTTQSCKLAQVIPLLTPYR